MNKVIFITGQTATGKTKLALDYAAQLNGELINCDSRQVYRFLDIVTGKDLIDKTFHQSSKFEDYTVGYYTLEGTKLWLYDIVEPSQYFSSHAYTTLALSVIKDILSRDKTPIVVGGTYFYMKHLLYGNTQELKNKPDTELRAKLSQMTKEQLQEFLSENHPERYKAMNNSDRQNIRRLIRAAERFISGVNNEMFSDKYTLGERLGNPSVEIECIGVTYEKKDHLVDTIEKRVDSRLAAGALDEVRNLIEQGYTLDDPGMKTIGYVELYNHLVNNGSLDDARKEWILRETQYAKRQYTFMKNDSHIKWRIIA